MSTRLYLWCRQVVHNMLFNNAVPIFIRVSKDVCWCAFVDCVSSIALRISPGVLRRFCGTGWPPLRDPGASSSFPAAAFWMGLCQHLRRGRSHDRRGWQRWRCPFAAASPSGVALAVTAVVDSHLLLCSKILLLPAYVLFVKLITHIDI